MTARSVPRRSSPTPVGGGGEVCANELTGESALVMVEIAGRRIAFKADQRTPLTIGESAGIRADPARTCFFDTATASPPDPHRFASPRGHVRRGRFSGYGNRC